LSGRDKNERESEANEQNKWSHLAAESPRVKVEDLTHQRIRSELHLEALREKGAQRVQLNDGRPTIEFELVSFERSECDRGMGEVGRVRGVRICNQKDDSERELPHTWREKREQD
jgi:hypothetical protein